ncbi:MAG TPA: glycosyl hydrolase family 18 protein, partial [Thermoproteota archaeon]|nr:glycosyl hydrolase family 18 protein [Thermoproteota archaeon]
FSVSDFSNHADAFTWVSPTGLYVDAEYKLGGTPAEVEPTARNESVMVLPLIANRDFDRTIVHGILSDAQARDSVIDQIDRFVESGGYDGVNIDFEDVPEGDRDLLTQFMQLLANRLRPKGKLITMDVPAKTSDTTIGWAGPYDYEALGRTCDLVILMVYDYHWSGGAPGAVSPLDWFEDVLRYSTSVIPTNKLMIGIPFYGYDWPSGGTASGVSFQQALGIAAQAGKPVRFSNGSGEYTFSYSKDGVNHEVWFQGAKSTELRLQVMERYGLNQVAAWCIGQEDPRTWEVIARS